ncbi:MAG: carboxypeptidase regulatory-like domain-containing protein [Deltaproteobacteria bacterium]|nr:carboxypeptidase regulatory-like domain-containing protein [Deltaproteobacteria bacterium]
MMRGFPRSAVFPTCLALLVTPGAVLAQGAADKGGASGQVDPEYDNEVAAGSNAVNADPATQTPVPTPAPAEAPPPEDERRKLHTWEWGAYRHHPNLTGTTGLLHMPEAGSGDAGTFALGLHGSWFTYSDYLVYGDEATRLWGDLNLRVTPLDFLEIFGGIKAQSMSNNKGNPDLFQSLGDVDLGVKGYWSPAGFVTIGGDFVVSFINSTGSVSPSFEGTSFGLDLLTSFDFAEINENAPIRVHLQVGYYFDRSANVIKDFEKDTGGCGTDSDNDGYVDYEGCLTPVERTALNVNRNDLFRIGLGVDMALPYVTPIIEYGLGIPINRQDFTCPLVPDSYDSCMDTEGASGLLQQLTLGVRVLPPIESLALDVGVDIGLAGYAPTVHEMAAQAPYQILFGASYSFDPFPKEPPLPPPPLPPPAPAAPPAELAGFVHDQASTGKPVAGAVVQYVGHELNPQVSDKDGRFRSYPLPAGKVALTVTAGGFEDGSFTVEVPASGLVAVDCPLVAAPVPETGKLAVRVTDPGGAPLAGMTVEVTGPTQASPVTGADGRFEIEVKEGGYTLTVDTAGYLRRQETVTTRLGATSQVEISLSAKPATDLVVLQKKRIIIKQAVHFETNSDKIKPESFKLLDQVAALMAGHPEVKLVEIQGHTDDRGNRVHNVDLSKRRAEAVRDYLLGVGMASSRLTAVGFGPDKPLAPNITPNGRNQNRRVEFHVKERE